MPNSCAAYGCNNRFGPESQLKKITFHQLPPPGEARRKLWIANSRRIDPITRKPWDPPFKYIYFCSDHFAPSDYEICGKTMGRRLKNNAVPTVFTFPTVVQPDPLEESTTQPAESTNSSTDEKSKHPHPGKPRNRKVVMLPKKIKLLQEAGESDVESVTIISFQHLDYSDKLQPIFEEAMIDLQYPEEAEEYYDDDYDVEDEYIESNDSLVKDQQPSPSGEGNESEDHMEDDENMDCSDDVLNKSTEIESGNCDQNDNANESSAAAETDDSRKDDCSIAKEGQGSSGNKGGDEHVGVSLKKTNESEEHAVISQKTQRPNTSEPEERIDVSQKRTNSSQPEERAGVSQKRTNTSQPEERAGVSQKRTNTSQPEERAGVSQKRTNTSQPEPVKPELQKVEEPIPKRKVPVVMKEISGIKDIEDLRIKSFKIAEDNIMLKRQVIYLERKLQEIVSQLYEK